MIQIQIQLTYQSTHNGMPRPAWLVICAGEPVLIFNRFCDAHRAVQGLQS